MSIFCNVFQNRPSVSISSVRCPRTITPCSRSSYVNYAASSRSPASVHGFYARNSAAPLTSRLPRHPLVLAGWRRKVVWLAARSSTSNRLVVRCVALRKRRMYQVVLQAAPASVWTTWPQEYRLLEISLNGTMLIVTNSFFVTLEFFPFI